MTRWRPTEVGAIAALSLTFLGGCSTDQCRQYSDYTCEQLERQTYNVYYYDVQRSTGVEQELFAGQVRGLGACSAAASSMAALRETDRDGNWSHICCLQTNDSDCAEKHR